MDFVIHLGLTETMAVRPMEGQALIRNAVQTVFLRARQNNCTATFSLEVPYARKNLIVAELTRYVKEFYSEPGIEWRVVEGEEITEGVWQIFVNFTQSSHSKFASPATINSCAKT